MHNSRHIRLSIPLLAISMFVSACNSGNNSSSSNNTALQSNQLQQYINSLKYAPTASKQLSGAGSYQQSFTTPGDLIINSIDIKFYLDNNCSAGASSVTLNGPVTPESGTYTSTNLSNNALCAKYNNATNNNSGCNGLFTDLSNGELQSMQFIYNINDGHDGSFPVAAPCMMNENAALGSSPTGIEGIANWTDPTHAVACDGSGNCGFSQAYNVSIVPPPVIFVSSLTYNGNLGGLAGADQSCNNDPAMPSFGSTYKALLVGNNATTADTKYYRPDGTYIATANSGMLVNNANDEPLTNAISSSSFTVWTGFGGDVANETCNNWTSSSNNDIGYKGTSDQLDEPYLRSNTPDCSEQNHLYCVKQ